jgi:protoporphyrin/coproporphyrin ferrochelatase
MLLQTRRALVLTSSYPREKQNKTLAKHRAPSARKIHHQRRRNDDDWSSVVVAAASSTSSSSSSSSSPSQQPSSSSRVLRPPSAVAPSPTSEEAEKEEMPPSSSSLLASTSFAFTPPSEGLGSSSSTSSSSSPPVQQRPWLPDEQGRKVGVLLLNLGGPETLEDVQPFLYNLFADDSIIRLPAAARFLQRPLAQLISTLRAPKSAEGYRAIGGGSPLLRITMEQATALEKALASRGTDARVYVGMRYWKPFMEDAVANLRSDGVTDLIVLPLYPQFSISTSGSSLRLLEAMMDADPALAGMRHAVVSSWYWRRGYLDAMADLITKELDKFADPSSVEIFFSAHGVPVSYVLEGDPYQAEMEDCVRLIMDRVKERGYGANGHTLAYQSRVGPVEWLTPYTDEKIRELGKEGTKAMLAVPVSFVSEHIETLEEIDVEYRELAEASGITQWRRVPALNTDARFIGDLADLVLDKLPACAPRPGWAPAQLLGEGGAVGAASAVGASMVMSLEDEDDEAFEERRRRANAGSVSVSTSSTTSVEQMPATPALATSASASASQQRATTLEDGEGDALGPPTGTVQALLKTYDRDRRVLPPPLSPFFGWGFNKNAETINGRVAMVAIISIAVIEILTGQGVLARFLSIG